MDMGCAGNPDVITPHLDRIAREGVRCSHAYATTPICSPNRATLLTGTYPTTHGLIYNDTIWRRELPTIGTAARDNGYRTGYIGKWHIDGMPREKFTPPGPRRAGFDDFWAVYNASHEYLTPRYYRDTPELIAEPGYEPEVQTRLAIEFLEGQKEDDRPFCLMLSCGPPHDPYERVPEKYRRLYDPDRLRLRQNCRIIPRECLDPAWSHRPTTADYYALITSLDDMMGRLLEYLDRSGLAEDTIVVFWSDHGDMLWSQGLLYKCMPYEESVNVPLLIRWPKGLPAGTQCDSLVGTADLFPTFAGLMGWSCPPSVEGVNLAPNLRGQSGATEPASAFLSHYFHYVFRNDQPARPWRGVRTSRYTFAMTQDRKPWLLFDNDLDPFQMSNLVGQRAFSGIEEQLKRETESWLDRLGDPFLPTDEMRQRCGTPFNWPEET